MSREEEKRMLRELNDKHLKIISEKQSDISCLQQKLETLEEFRLELHELTNQKLNCCNLDQHVWRKLGESLRSPSES